MSAADLLDPFLILQRHVTWEEASPAREGPTGARVMQVKSLLKLPDGLKAVLLVVPTEGEGSGRL